MSRVRPSTLWLLLPIALAYSAAGCNTLDAPLSDVFAEGGPSETPVAAAGDRPTFSVEFRSASGRGERVELALDDATFVQQALDTSRARKRFGRFKLALLRPGPAPAGFQKLDITYDRSRRRVPPEFDYALHPGDRLIVTEDTSDVLDDLLETAGKKFGVAVPQ